MRHPILLVAIVPLIAFLAGCGDEPQASSPQPAPEPPKSDLQRKIDNTEAASAVGYDGGAVKHAVQGMVDSNQRHNDRIQEAADATRDAEPEAEK